MILIAWTNGAEMNYELAAQENVKMAEHEHSFSHSNAYVVVFMSASLVVFYARNRP